MSLFYFWCANSYSIAPSTSTTSLVKKGADNTVLDVYKANQTFRTRAKIQREQPVRRTTLPRMPDSRPSSPSVLRNVFSKHEINVFSPILQAVTWGR